MNKPYERLKFAIIKQAVKDYISALKKRNFAKMRECERFFKSEWGDFLCDGHADLLMDKCKKRAEFSEN